MRSVAVERRVIAGAFLALSLIASGSRPGAFRADETARRVSVIVQSLLGSAHAEESVTKTGGTVTRRLPIVSGVTATVPATSLPTLKALDGLQVTRNSPVRFDDHVSDSFTEERQRIPKMLRSDKLWSEGVTGRGVTVALIDTGVYSHPDLSGRVIKCVDFSHEEDSDAECADTFGHGTFMAGLIAGDGAKSGGKFRGTAPEANLVSVKIAGFDGATDVSLVLAGIQWVVAHRDQYNIKVLNLSLGSDSGQTYSLSPLNYAVQRAWKSGITVVVSAGNSGSNPKTILKPADDPYVVTVGSSDDQGTWDVKDDRVAAFSSRGPTRSDGVPKPDIVVPGVHTISLRSPGSAIDQAYGESAVIHSAYFRGTGTSMSAATVTGAVAQLLQANPKLEPDQVKHRLISTARDIATTDGYSVGAGSVDAYSATKSSSTSKANQGLSLGLGNGLGTLESDRGSVSLTANTPMGEGVLSGEFVSQYDEALVSLDNPLGLVPWVSATYTTTGWDPTSWALLWAGADWAAARWKDGSFQETVWEAARWKGSDWSNADWDAARWKDVQWDAARWKASNWQTAWYAAAWD